MNYSYIVYIILASFIAILLFSLMIGPTILDRLLSFHLISTKLVILILALITNPLSAHATARSALISGYRPKQYKTEEK